MKSRVICVLVVEPMILQHPRAIGTESKRAAFIIQRLVLVASIGRASEAFGTRACKHAA